MSDDPIFDFESSQVPQLKALQNSYTNNDLEREIKELFIDLFKTHLGEESFNAFVLGAQHLGSYSLVQRSINEDGLVLINSDIIEATTRYLYRTWKSGDVQKRGLHIAKMYLRLLFGDNAQVSQLQQPIDLEYPATVYLDPFDPNEGVKEGYFLTSRINLDVDFSISDQPIKQVVNSIQSVIPAKYVPELRFINITTQVYLDLKFIQFGALTTFYYAEGELQQEVRDVHTQSKVTQAMKPQMTAYFHAKGHIIDNGEK